MKTEILNLWEATPGLCEEIPSITAYIPDKKISDGAIVIFPGGGYGMRAEHEGAGYAKFLASHGITAFVCGYRVKPHSFPLPLLDARRAVRFVRFNNQKYGLDKNKIYVMGSSAGAHLAALLSTYYDSIEHENYDDIDKENYKPDGQILCYPVIKLLRAGIAHLGSGKNLLGDRQAELGEALSPDLIATSDAPKAFVWHTYNDSGVSVINSLDYVKRLREVGVEAELHVFPGGDHGMGLAKEVPHVAQWSNLLINWLGFNSFFEQSF